MHHNIKNKYEINFHSAIEIRPDGLQIIDKRVDTINDRLSEFLYGWETASEIDEDLLPAIDVILDKLTPFGETQSETVGVYMTFISTKLFSFYSGKSIADPDYSLSTIDFKLIIELWRNYLLQPPLNGSRI